MVVLREAVRLVAHVLQQPQRGNQQSDCKVSDYKLAGNKVTYSMKCTTPQPMDATGEILYGDNTYDGTLYCFGLDGARRSQEERR